MKLLINALVALTAVASGSVVAADAEAGESKAQMCAACHGAGGNSTISSNPILAGQYASYLEFALKSYRDGSRKNPIMSSQASGLSDEDIADLAAYFADQKAVLSVVPKD